MWKYIKKYSIFGIMAAMFMVLEVLMDLLQPEIMSKIVDNGVLGVNNNGVGNIDIIWKYGLLMICLVLFGGLCGSLNNAFVHITSQNTGNDMRKDIFRKIMTFSFSEIENFGTGSLIVRVTNDITQVEHFVALFIRSIVRTFMLIFGSIFFMFRLNYTFGIIVLTILPFIIGWLIFCIKRANPFFIKLQLQLDKINDILQEDISGIRMIKACVREVYEKFRFGKANDELIKTQLKVLIIFVFMNPVINVLMYVVITLLLLVGSYQVQNNFTTPGLIMAAITYTTQLLHGILNLVMIFQNISRGFVSWKRIKETLQIEPKIKSGSFFGRANTFGKIEFKDVSFAYPGSKREVLKNINLTILPGETVAIMGSTGCGKTSLVNLIPRFYDVTKGKILIDDIDVKEYALQALREKISIVLQNSELFNASIEENILFGSPNADFEAIKKAATIAQGDKFISETIDGYKTIVAERGVSLSGGQKQRISIARAILKSSNILIFDDSTSALDLKTEAELYKALQESNSNITKIIVAQRVASVRNADRIIILEGGKIIASGSHDELINTCHSYIDIYNSQLGEGGECSA